MIPKISLDKLVIYDLETLRTLFVANLIDYKTGKRKSFVFYNTPEYSTQPLELFKFLRSTIRNGYSFLGFNNIAFDAEIIQFFYDWCCQKQDPLYQFDIEYIITQLYTKAQELIAQQEGFRNSTPPYKLFAPQIDLYVQSHFDRPQKRTSLKWLEFSMRLPNIQEMPVEHDAEIAPEQVEDVVNYCWNDVDSTLEFFNRIKFETELRLKISAEYDKNLVNAPEPRLAREIFGKFLCEDMKIPYGELKLMKTIRTKVAFKDIIFSYTKFHTPQLQQLLEELNGVEVDCNAPEFKKSFVYNGLNVDMGLGGIHACAAAGIYAPLEDEIMADSDATSFYPNLAIQNGLRPEHLGESFTKIYSDIFEKRKLIPKKDPVNYVYKILLNSTYGLSREPNSYFFDSKFCYGITINGQLSLLMLCEALYLSIPGLRIVQKNTDGITYIFKKQYKDKVEKIWKWWETVTKINLEHAYYSKMVILDVNNYMAIGVDGKAKKKGSFETEMFLHKNPSYLIIPKALEAYFVSGTPVSDFIRSTGNIIYDFCAGVKKKSNFKLNLVKNYSGIEMLEEQQKVTRFFVSTQTGNSGLLVKDFNDGRRVSVLANKQIVPCNTILQDKANLYPIDYQWYEQQANKIIATITPPVIQSSLF